MCAPGKKDTSWAAPRTSSLDRRGGPAGARSSQKAAPPPQRSPASRCWPWRRARLTTRTTTDVAPARSGSNTAWPAAIHIRPASSSGPRHAGFAARVGVGALRDRHRPAAAPGRRPWRSKHRARARLHREGRCHRAAATRESVPRCVASDKRTGRPGGHALHARDGSRMAVRSPKPPVCRARPAARRPRLGHRASDINSFGFEAGALTPTAGCRGWVALRMPRQQGAAVEHGAGRAGGALTPRAAPRQPHAHPTAAHLP